MVSLVGGLNERSIAHITSRVIARVAIEDLLVEACLGDAHTVILSNNGREVAGNQQEVPRIASLAHINGDTVMAIHAVDPLEAFGFEIDFVQSRLIDHQVVQVGQHFLDAAMRFPLQQFPLDLRIVIPLVPLGEFAAHEQQLLAGVRPHVGVQQPQVRELLPQVARHLTDQRSLAVHDFVVRQAAGRNSR